MNKYSWVILALLLMLVVVVGCSKAEQQVDTQDQASNKEAAQQQAETTKTAETAETAVEMRTVSTVNGDIEIPVHPQRIAATYYAGELAALGLKPSGTVTRLLSASSPHLSGYTDDAADLGQFPPNAEAIIDLEPDLIVAADFDELDTVQLAAVAPTLVLPWTNDDVWAKLRTLAGYLGKEAEAEQYVAQYEEAAEAARLEIADSVQAGETVSVIRFMGKSSFRVYGGRDVGHAFYEGLQLQMPEAVAQLAAAQESFTSSEDLSLEEIGLYTGDRVFVLVTNEEGEAGYQEAQELAVWTSLPAVQNGQVYELPAELWFTYDPISVQRTLEEAVTLIKEGARP